jgi:hypothetical protein
MSTNQIRLDELLARQVEVQWYEGVAIVQAICNQLLAQGDSNGDFPAVTQIGLRTDGTVKVLGTMSTHAVQAAAHLLAGMLSEDVPVRLRLVVSQATGENSTIANLREFSETLKYFERPDGEQIVRNLLERAMLASFRKQADEPGLEDFKPQEQPKTAARPLQENKSRWRVPAMVAALGIVVISGLAWFASQGGGVSAAYSGITNALAGEPEARPNEPVENARTPQESAAKGATPPHRAPSATAADADRKPAAPSKAKPAVVAGRIPSLVPSAASAKLPMPSLDGSIGAQAVQTYVIYATEPGESASEPVYSKADAAVTPPRQVYPALPAEPSAASLKGALTVVDMIVAPDGLVERVHLRTTPRTVHEFMLLSAVKAWRFQPALLDGRPVRFRHSVALTSFQ